MTTDTDEYLLGSSDAELNRLAYQHEVWRPEARALWDRAGIREGQRVLDLGCGPGFASVDLAERVGASGKVVAYDLSTKFLDHLRKVAAARGLSQVEPVEGSVEQLSLSEPVDHVYSRWLFCFLPRPDIVVKQIAGVLKKGGRVSICDYFALDYILVPKSAAFERLIAAIIASWKSVGGTITIQQKMPSVLERNGFRIVDMTPISRVGKAGSPYWNWPKSFFVVFVPQLVAKGLLTQAEADQFWKEWGEREKDPSSLMKTPTFLDIVAEKI